MNPVVSFTINVCHFLEHKMLKANDKRLPEKKVDKKVPSEILVSAEIL